jgi:hypothetical protein
MDTSQSYTLLRTNLFLIVLFMTLDKDDEEDRVYIKYILGAAGLYGVYSMIYDTTKKIEPVPPPVIIPPIIVDPVIVDPVIVDPLTVVNFGDVIHIAKVGGVNKLSLYYEEGTEVSHSGTSTQLVLVSPKGKTGQVWYNDEITVTKLVSPDSRLKMKSGKAYEVSDDDEPQYSTFRLVGWTGDESGPIVYGNQIYVEKRDGDYQLALKDTKAYEVKEDKHKDETKLAIYRYIPVIVDPATVVNFGDVIHIAKVGGVNKLSLLNQEATEATHSGTSTQLVLVSPIGKTGQVWYNDEITVTKLVSPVSRLKMFDGKAYEVNDDDQPQYSTFRLVGWTGSESGPIVYGNQIYVEMRDGDYQLAMLDYKAYEVNNDKHKDETKLAIYRYIPVIVDPLTVVNFGDIIHITKLVSRVSKLSLLDSKATEVSHSGTSTQLVLVSPIGKTGQVHYNDEITITKLVSPVSRLKMKSGKAYEVNNDDEPQYSTFRLVGWTGTESEPIVYGNQIYVEKRDGDYQLALLDTKAYEVKEDKHKDETKLVIDRYVPEVIDLGSVVKFNTPIHLHAFSSNWKLGLLNSKAFGTNSTGIETVLVVVSTQGKEGVVSYNDELVIAKWYHLSSRLKMKDDRGYEVQNELSENTKFKLVGWTGTESGPIKLGAEIWVEKVGKYQLALPGGNDRTDAREWEMDKHKSETKMMILNYK